jgi:dTDP-4-dehydrorhamnose 3,5-epimerase
MIAHDTGIKDLLLLEPKVFGDHRGYFLESFRQELFDELTGGHFAFVQDNESRSGKGVLRGLHFQRPPFTQGKLVRVVRGSVLDVALDIRRSSPTYGQHFAVELNEFNKLQLWIPPGFAHGFASLEDDTIFQYKCTNYYSPENEGAVLWNDAELDIDWKINDPIISDKDRNALPLAQLVSPFE